MMQIRKREMEFLSSEIDLWLENGIITDEQADNILELYEIKKSNLRMILFIAGGILLGLGGVSFAAAQWHELPKLLRVFMIAGGYLGSLAVYIIAGGSSTRSGRSFLLLASIIFGSGIFLITRMYNIPLYFRDITGWWTVAALITAITAKDFWQLYLSQILAFLYLHAVSAIDIFALEFMSLARVSIIEFFMPLQAFALLAVLWFACWRINDRLAFNINTLITILLLASRMTLCLGGTVTLIILALSGALLSFTRRNDTEITGLLMLGMFGLLLTWPEFWRGDAFIGNSNYLSVASALVIAPVMIINIYRGHSGIGIIFCALLASRYFFDHLFGYIPKAWGFTLLGIIFMIAALFFGHIKKYFVKAVKDEAKDESKDELSDA